MHRVMNEVSLWVGEAYGNRLTIHGVDHDLPRHDLPRLAGETLLRVRADTVTVAGYLFFRLEQLVVHQEKRVSKG